MELASTHQTFHVDVNLIYPDDEFNCRGIIDPQLLGTLASSIHDTGLQIPVIVWPQSNLPNGCQYLLVAGYRRFIACTKLLRHRTILATIRPDLTHETAKQLNFTENLERKDLSILQEAKALQASFPDVEAPVIAKTLNRSFRWVNLRRMLLELPVEVQEAADHGEILVNDIEVIHSIPQRFQLELLAKVLNSRAAGNRVQTVKYKTSTGKKAAIKPSQKKLKEMLLFFQRRGYRGVVLKIIKYAMGLITHEELQQHVIDNPKERIR